MKKYFFLFLTILCGGSLVFFLYFHHISAENKELPTQNTAQPVFNISAEKVPIEVFERPDCKHCRTEKDFFMEIKLRRDDFTVRFHDISESDHYEHWLQITELENLPKNTPITLVGNTILLGFDSRATTGKSIENLIDQSKGKNTLNLEEFIKAGGSVNIESVAYPTCDAEVGICAIEHEPLLATIPFFGVIDLKKYSLPTLSVIFGFIDGFNPCAMWVLITFLLVLTQVGSRKKMWQIAGFFIIAEAIMYYLILNLWMTTWNFVRLDHIITPIVGIVAIGGGIFFLYEWKTSDGTCKVTNMKQRAKISKKINYLAEAEMTILTILGIIGLALSVNIIEFACSIGIPQVFTKILDLNSFTLLYEQFYMGLYILFYMIDDIIVFGIALYSFEKIGLTKKYSKLSHLIGGLLMVVLGALLLVAPSLLVF